MIIENIQPKCDFCVNVYNIENLPITLPCSHSICNSCYFRYYEKFNIHTDFAFHCVKCNFEINADFNIIPIKPSICTENVAKKRLKLIVCDIGKGKTAFFLGNLYYRFDNFKDCIDKGYPKQLNSVMKNIWPMGFDTCFKIDSDTLCLIKDDLVMYYSISKNQILLNFPKKIQAQWPNLPYSSNIDAAIQCKPNEIIFFKGPNFIKYDYIKQQCVKSEQKISLKWKGIWEDYIDSIINWYGDAGKGRFYVFRKNQFMRISKKNKCIDPGYPQEIKIGWQGIPDILFEN